MFEPPAGFWYWSRTRSRAGSVGWSAVIFTDSKPSKLESGPEVSSTRVIRSSVRSNSTLGSPTTGTFAATSNETSFDVEIPSGSPGNVYWGSVTSTLGISSSAKRTGPPQPASARSRGAVGRIRARMVARLLEVEEDSDLRRGDRRPEGGVGDPHRDLLAGAVGGRGGGGAARRGPEIGDPGADEEDEATRGA